MARQHYSIDGWIPLGSKHVKFADTVPEISVLEAQVTEETTINVYLDQGRCEGKRMQNYHLICTSDQGFTVEDILHKIHKTYWRACQRLFNGDTAFFDNLALHSFEFDPETNSVYPDTDS